MKREIITIAGRAGSGKSSTAKSVAEALGWKHFSSGDYLRSVAKRKGMDITTLMREAENNPRIDIEIDEQLKKIGEDEKIVIDSRLAFHWIPESFKVFLELDPELSAKRMFVDLAQNASRRSSEKAKTEEEMKEKLKTRLSSDTKRYQNLYGIGYTDHKNFDLVINTGNPENNLEKVIRQVIQEYEKWHGK